MEENKDQLRKIKLGEEDWEIITPKLRSLKKRTFMKKFTHKPGLLQKPLVYTNIYIDNWIEKQNKKKKML